MHDCYGKANHMQSLFSQKDSKKDGLKNTTLMDAIFSMDKACWGPSESNLHACQNFG